jgi:hypothetical protein
MWSTFQILKLEHFSRPVASDVSPRRAMYLMGQDPTLTLGVYQQVMDVSDHALDLLEEPRNAKGPLGGLSEERMKGLEPSTFCMASPPINNLLPAKKRFMTDS